MPQEDPLVELDLIGQVQPEGLYVVDDNMAMVVTDWKESKAWAHIGSEVERRQLSDHGIYIASIIDGEPKAASSRFPLKSEIDKMIGSAYNETETNLLESFDKSNVRIQVRAGYTSAIFTHKDMAHPIDMNYVMLLKDMAASLRPPVSTESPLSFVAGKGTIGIIKPITDSEFYEGHNESTESTWEMLTEFEHSYTRARKSSEWRTEDKKDELRFDFLEMLEQIAGYERHRDSSLEMRVREIMEELFPMVHIKRGITFPERSTSLFHVVNPDRLIHLGKSGGNWVAFVADWDKGYSDDLGTFIPITEDIAMYLKNKIPDLEIKED
jgi:hypothetical protein